MLQGLELLLVGMLSVFIVMLLIYLLVFVLSKGKQDQEMPKEELSVSSEPDQEAEILAVIIAAVKQEMGILSDDRQWQISIERIKEE